MKFKLVKEFAKRSTKINLSQIFADGDLQKYVSQNTSDPWVETRFAKYVHLAPKAKGEFGERFVQSLFKLNKFDVHRAHSATAGYDRIIKDIKTEIKFSLATRDKKNGGVKKDSFIINHVSKGKDWERLVFVGVNSETDIRILWFTRGDFTTYLEDSSCVFNNQQGGKKINNDDFICTNIPKLMENGFVNSGIENW